MTFSSISDYADENTAIGDNCRGCVQNIVFKLFTRLKCIMITAAPQQNTQF